MPSFVLVTLGCLLLFTGCVSPGNMSQKPPTTVSAGVTGRLVILQALCMFDVTNGWATTFDGEQVLHTSKGVLHWREVTPQRFARSDSQRVRLEAVDFMDALRGWVIFSLDLTSSGPLTQEPLFVERTTDGGQTWQETTIVRQSSAFAQQITFLTPQVGWLLLSEGAALGSEGVEVLRTTNGGATWQTMTRTSNTTSNLPGSLPFAGVKSGISFINLTTGWITGMMEGLYQTHDGGTTWYRQSLPLPDTLPPATRAYLAYTGPLFTFNGREGIFPVNLGLSDGRVIPEVYRTHDGGHTWQATAALPAWLDTISFLSPQTGWTAGVQNDTLFLYSTADGGHIWKPFTQALPPGVTRITELHFVTQLTGWMIGERNEGQSTLLLQTTDGGQTWREVQPLLEVVAHSPEETAET
jgi:photosystem II stability/assembly factor-like uncharacterized protein